MKNDNPEYDRDYVVNVFVRGFSVKTENSPIKGRTTPIRPEKNFWRQRPYSWIWGWSGCESLFATPKVNPVSTPPQESGRASGDTHCRVFLLTLHAVFMYRPLEGKLGRPTWVQTGVNTLAVQGGKG